MDAYAEHKKNYADPPPHSVSSSREFMALPCTSATMRQQSPTTRRYSARRGMWKARAHEAGKSVTLG